MRSKRTMMAKSLNKIPHSIPSQHLFQSLPTEDLRGLFFQLRQDAIGLCLALRSKFGAGGNPVQRAFKEGRISELERDWGEATTEYYLALWDLIEFGFIYLEDDFALFEGAPKSDIELFKRILIEEYDSRLIAAKAGYSYIEQKSEKEVRRQKNLLRGLVDESEITQKDKELETDLYWWSLSFRLLLNAAKKDSLLKAKIQSFFSAGATMQDRAELFLRDRRKSRKSQSVKWENGLKYRGTKGGGWLLQNFTN